jgi:hypothetical protein
VILKRLTTLARRRENRVPKTLPDSFAKSKNMLDIFSKHSIIILTGSHCLKVADKKLPVKDLGVVALFRFPQNKRTGSGDYLTFRFEFVI